MGVAYFIFLEREIDGLDANFDGKKLAKAADSLDRLALKLDTRPISAFFSIDPMQAAEFLKDQDVEVDDLEFAPLVNFSAEEGLTTITALLAHPDSNDAIGDLKECERILSVAAQHHVGWHFEVDF